MRKTVLTVMAVCGVTTALGACTMVPDYLRPGFSAAEQWNDVPGYETAQGEQAAQNLHWRNFFKDPALRQVIAIALEHNKDLRMAALNIDAARAQYRIERADIVPSVNANADATYQESSDESSVTGRSERTDLYDANLGISAYELDLFGRVRSKNQAALNDYLATESARDVVRNRLIAEVANAYLRLLADQKLLALTEKTLAAQENTYDLLSRTRDEGVATESDVSRAQTAVETARVNLHQYRRLVEQDKNALTLLMGVPHSEGMIPVSGLENIDVPVALDPGLPSDVLTARPDIRQAEYELLARNADIGAARAAFFPQISLTGTYGFASDSLSDLFTSGAAGAWRFVPQVTLPVFQGGRNKANLELAEIRKESAIVNYEKAIQTAFREVSDELAARATLTEQLEAQRRLVAASERVYNMSDERYKAGIDSFLSVLDAQRELYVAQQNEIQTERQRLTNLVNLYRVLGGGSFGEDEVR
ncbi:MAG: efflux transporter outer membrane subunit [Alphaproteobacteria bacterium]|jgi:multidrug efflux system outer membrane protein|nr:efflux transporter outer membrane subunit [Alphaproteobacteria bacterium]MDP7223493.1 efflux transporter outer membrane subunit [Alphaproteobacteria bacterium]